MKGVTLCNNELLVNDTPSGDYTMECFLIFQNKRKKLSDANARSLDWFIFPQQS